MRIKSVIISFLVYLLFWIGLNLSVRKDVLLVGVIVSLIITLISAKSKILNDIKITPKSLIAFTSWLIIFFIELIKSNVDVMIRVLSPNVKINPAIVEVKTSLKTKLGRLALANSITLTPGTLTTDIINDKLYIHWIDASSTDLDTTTKKIVEKFEKHLEVIFG